jgi:sulfide:quinone oxidoreductase
MTESIAKVAAHNIAADLESSRRDSLPLADLAAMCILDAGNNGVIFRANHVLANGTGNAKVAKAHIMAGPQAHWAKLAFERVYLGSRKRGALVL